jgi:hypothetical protein
VVAKMAGKAIKSHLWHLVANKAIYAAWLFLPRLAAGGFSGLMWLFLPPMESALYSGCVCYFA